MFARGVCIYIYNPRYTHAHTHIRVGTFFLCFFFFIQSWKTSRFRTVPVRMIFSSFEWTKVITRRGIVPRAYIVCLQRARIKKEKGVNWTNARVPESDLPTLYLIWVFSPRSCPLLAKTNKSAKRMLRGGRAFNLISQNVMCRVRFYTIYWILDI